MLFQYHKLSGPIVISISQFRVSVCHGSGGLKSQSVHVTFCENLSEDKGETQRNVQTAF